MTGNALRTAVPAVVLAAAALIYFLWAASSADLGAAIGVAVFAGPIVLLLLLARIGGSSSQSPLALTALLIMGVLAGAGWGAFLLASDVSDLVAGVAATLLPIILAGGLTVLLAKFGMVDEGLDVLAYSAAVTFGWASALSGVLYGTSMRIGSLDFIDTGTLVAAIMSEATFRPIGTAAAASMMALLLHAVRPTRNPWLPALAILLSLTVGLWAQLAWPDDAGTAALALTSLVALVMAYMSVSGAQPPDPPDSASQDEPSERTATDGPGQPTAERAQGGSSAHLVGEVKSAGATEAGAKSVLGDEIEGTDQPHPRTIQRGDVPRPTAWPPKKGRNRVQRSPTPLAVFGSVLAVFLAIQAWSWMDTHRAETSACEPFCGPTPIPPEPPDDQPPQEFVSASGWRILYSRRDGQPTRNEENLISWRWGPPTGGRDVPVEVVFQSSRGSLSAEEFCEQVVRENAQGFRSVYKIPNAGLGVYLGTGEALERATARPGKAPSREGIFLTCVQASNVVVAGWAKGLRQPKLAFNGHHYDPSYSQAAQYLGRFSARFEFLDQEGKPVYG